MNSGRPASSGAAVGAGGTTVGATVGVACGEPQAASASVVTIAIAATIIRGVGNIFT